MWSVSRYQVRWTSPTRLQDEIPKEAANRLGLSSKKKIPDREVRDKLENGCRFHDKPALGGTKTLSHGTLTAPRDRITNPMSWLRQTEAAWNEHARKDSAGAAKITLRQRIDYVRGLSLQLIKSEVRIAYSKAGTLPAAAIIENPELIIDHMAYWTTLRSRAEGQYLCTIINSESALKRITELQAKGQGGARHFDNLVWELKIPEYDRKVALHRNLAAAAVEAEAVAAQVELTEGAYFTTQRRAIRDALKAAGIAAKIDALVECLLTQ